MSRPGYCYSGRPHHVKMVRSCIKTLESYRNLVDISIELQYTVVIQILKPYDDKSSESRGIVIKCLAFLTHQSV